MIEMKRAAIRTENGHQVIVLPDDIHFDEAEVAILHNLDTGELTVKPEALIEREAARRVIALAGSEPNLAAPPRRRSTPA